MGKGTCCPTDPLSLISGSHNIGKIRLFGFSSDFHKYTVIGMCFPPCVHVKEILKIKIKNAFSHTSTMVCMYTQVHIEVFCTCFYLALIPCTEPFSLLSYRVMCYEDFQAPAASKQMPVHDYRWRTLWRINKENEMQIIFSTKNSVIYFVLDVFPYITI